MFVTIRYGKNQQAILNPDSKVANFISMVRNLSGCEKQAELAFCDETGNVRVLTECNYANEILQEREVLIPLKVIRQGKKIEFQPLLEDESITEEFISKLALENGKNAKGRSRAKGKGGAATDQAATGLKTRDAKKGTSVSPATRAKKTK